MELLLFFIAGSPFLKSPLDISQIRDSSGISRGKKDTGGVSFFYLCIGNDMPIEGPW